jgi:uncharacterized protein YbaA (DUF1428 family)
MPKGKYVDGFVIAIPKKNKEAYIKMAKEGRAAWKKFGALDYKECVLDIEKPNECISLTFPQMIQAKPGETVWFSFITYKSKKHRDEVNKKVMAYFEKKYSAKEMKMPFDMQRFTCAGFTVEVGM